MLDKTFDVLDKTSENTKQLFITPRKNPLPMSYMNTFSPSLLLSLEAAAAAELTGILADLYLWIHRCKGDNTI